MKRFVFLSVLVLSATFSLAKWGRMPTVAKRQVNMCLKTSGTTIQSASNIGPETAILGGDPTRAVNAAAGKSSLVIKFVKQSVVSKALFTSDGLEGKVLAQVSGDGKAWRGEVSAVFSKADRTINLQLGAKQVRYLKLDLELVRAGSLRSLQVFGDQTDANYKIEPSEDGKGTVVNFGSGIGGGRLVYINPQDYKSGEDALALNQLEFPESDDKYRTAVYDLGQVRSLTEFGSVHSPRPVRLAVFAFEALPEKEDWRGRLAFDPKAFDNVQPVAVGEDSAGLGTIQMKTQKPVKVRYLAMRWEPDFNPPSFSVSSPVMGGPVASVSFSAPGVSVTTTAAGTTVSSSGSGGGDSGGGGGDGGDSGDGGDGGGGDSGGDSGDGGDGGGGDGGGGDSGGGDSGGGDSGGGGDGGGGGAMAGPPPTPPSSASGLPPSAASGD